MMTKMISVLAAASLMTALVGFERDASADVNITLTPGESAEYAESLGIDVQELEDRLRQEIADAMGDIDPNDYAQSLADAQVFSSKGLGVDYASNAKNFVFGAGANVTVAVGDDGFDEARSDRPVAAPGINFSLMAGINLATFAPNLDRVTVFANGFLFSGGLNQLETEFRNFGAHVQYQLIKPTAGKPGIVVKWGGIAITTGFQYSKWTLSLEDELDTELDVGNDTMGQPIPATLTTTGRFELNAEAFTVPIEASTSIRFFSVLSVFGGVGFDYQNGSSSIDVDLTGDVVATPDNDELDIGTAQVEVTGDSTPNAAKMRFFGGVQANMWKLRAFVHANLAVDRAIGLSFGAGGAW